MKISFPPNSYLADKEKLERRSIHFIIAFGILLFSILDGFEVKAQCTGTPEWQFAKTNLMRCGRAGYENSNTFYFIEETIITESKAGVGTYYSEHLAVTTGPRFSPLYTTCPGYTVDYINVSVTAGASYKPPGCPDISGPLSCDSTGGCLPYCPGGGSDLNSSAALAIYVHILDGAQSCSAPPVTETANTLMSILAETDTSCPYTYQRLEVRELSSPYTLPEFIKDTFDSATASGWLTTSASSPSSYLKWDVAGGAELEAQILRYRIKFKSKIGVKYTVKWDLRIEQSEYYFLPYTVTNTYIMKDLSQGDIIGNGKEMWTDWRETPRPQILEKYVVTPFNIRIESDGGGCGPGGCGGEDGDWTGDGQDSLSSASFFISLGAGNLDGTAGVLKMDEETPTGILSTPSALTFDLSTSVNVATNLDGSIHLAAPTMLARIVVTNSYAYWVHCSVTNAGGGNFLTNAPFISHLIVNPNGSTNFNTLQHIRYRSGSVVTNEFVCEVSNATNSTWRLVSGNGLKGERLAKIANTNDSTRLESYSIFTPATSAQLYRRDRLYWSQVHGEFLLSETIDPTDLNLTTTNTYDSLGRLQLSVKADGSWERHEYDANGWRIRIVQPFTNQPPTASTNDCRVTEYSYSSVSGSPDNIYYHLTKPRTVWKLVRGEVVSKLMIAYDGNYTYTRVASHSNAGWTDAANENSYSIQDSAFRIIDAHNADGTYNTYTYSDNSSGRLTTARSYSSSSAEFRKIEEQVDTLGRMVSRKTYDSASGKLVDQQLYSDPDEFLSPTKVTFLNATTSVTVRQDCCNAAYTIDRDGIASTNSYDALKRLVSTIRLGITASNLLDAADRTLAQFRKGTDGSLITLRTLGYDAAHRVIRETNALGAVTSFSHGVDGSNQRILTTTNADGSTRIET